MRTKKIIITCIIALLILAVYFKNLVGAVLIHSEHIDKSAFTSMLIARLNPEKVVVLKLGNQSYSIPLPKGVQSLKISNTKDFPQVSSFYLQQHSLIWISMRIHYLSMDG